MHLIIGAGITGMSIAKALKEKDPACEVVIIEKEPDVGYHASGRNSGVLHAGFYYSADSLKAKFCREGNIEWHTFVEENQLSINKCGKLVVAKNEIELEGLKVLYERGLKNNVPVQLVSEKQAKELEPNVKTFRQALWSPTTSSISPKQCNLSLKSNLEKMGVVFEFNKPVTHIKDSYIFSRKSSYKPDYIYNAAGLYADKIAHKFGSGLEYTLLPFKGIYRRCIGDVPVKKHIYPVPNLANPFLGVHFTQTVNGVSKIGPTATPAFWRENYSGFGRFQISEMVQIMSKQVNLFLRNSFGFRSLAVEEIKKYRASYLEQEASQLVASFNTKTEPMAAGIRAQLLHKKDKKLVSDFVIEKDAGVTHILNSISPAWTCAFPFARYIVSRTRS
jgi:L-2-hydroxyglutarate oxidase LhgO